MHLTDGLINRYLDNDLNHIEISEVSSHLQSCSECLSKMKAFQAAENQLKNIDTYHVSSDFTSKVMGRISGSFVKINKGGSYFFRVVFSIFIVAALGICVFAFAQIPSGNGAENINLYESVNKFTSGIYSSYKTVFSKQLTSVLGSIILFSVIAVIYLIYDSQKNIRDQFNKLK